VLRDAAPAPALAAALEAERVPAAEAWDAVVLGPGPFEGVPGGVVQRWPKGSAAPRGTSDPARRKYARDAIDHAAPEDRL